MKYNNFDQLINEGPGLNLKDRQQFVTEWLKTSYGIQNAPEDWVTQISDVHDHNDGQPRHFGKIKIASSFTSMTTQLLKLHGVWHFGVLIKDAEQGTVIHPLTENNNSVENEKLRLNLVRLVKTGKVPKSGTLPTFSINFDKAPAQEAASTDIYVQKDADQILADDINTAPVSDNVKTKSVGVDLSAYL